MKGDAMRGCDGCTACCTSLAVQFDDHLKPAGTKCGNCLVNACGIYRDRPLDCRRFECAFVSGKRNSRWTLTGKFWPPRANVFLAFTPFGGIDAYLIEPRNPIHGAVRRVLNEVAAYIPIQLIEGGERKMMFRKAKRGEFLSEDAGALLDQAAAIKRAAKKRA